MKYPSHHLEVGTTMRNGHLLLIHNGSITDRMPLVAAVSTDNDAIYPHRRRRADGPGPSTCPFAIQAGNGRIQSVFTTENRTVINHTECDEDYVPGAESRNSRGTSP
jgi:hypothetical protein